MAVYRSDQFSIHLTVIGLPEGRQTDTIQWDSMEGGEQAVEGQTYLAGGMFPLISVGGIPKRTPATLKRIWSDSLIPLVKAMENTAGQARVNLTLQTLNPQRTPVGEVFTYTGTLGTITKPNYGAETPEKAYLTVMCDLDGEVK